MNPYLLAGAVLAIVMGAAHSVLGERYILIRLFRRPNLPKLFGSDDFTVRTLRFAWHMTTLAWWGFAALLCIYGSRAGDEAARLALAAIAATFLASAVMAFAGSRGKHLAWIVFLAIALAAWFWG